MHHGLALRDPDGAVAERKPGSVAELPRTPPGFAAAVEAALRGLRPGPAVLEAALEAMAAITATVALLDRG